MFNNLQMIVGVGSIAGARRKANGGTSIEKIGIAAAEVTVVNNSLRINFKAFPIKSFYPIRNRVVTGITLDDNGEFIGKTGSVDKYPCYFLDSKNEVGPIATAFCSTDITNKLNFIVLWKNDDKKNPKDVTYTVFDVRSFTISSLSTDCLCYCSKMETNILNAKVVEKDGSKYLAGINWNIPTITGASLPASDPRTKQNDAMIKDLAYATYWTNHMDEIPQTAEGLKTIERIGKILGKKLQYVK